jgi:hypothetical protein
MMVEVVLKLVEFDDVEPFKNVNFFPLKATPEFHYQGNKIT